MTRSAGLFLFCIAILSVLFVTGAVTDEKMYVYPVRYEGEKRTVDLTSHGQALQFSPDGKNAGPVTCGTCHTVNQKGIPVQLRGTDYYNDYWASVALIHFMREGDQKASVADLIRKYPYRRAKEIVMKGWK